MNPKSKKSVIKKYIPTAFFVLAVIITLLSLNSTPFFPWETSSDLSSPLVMDATDDLNVIVDSQGERLLFTDSTMHIIKSINVNKAKKIDTVNDVKISDRYVYVCGTTRAADRTIITGGKILRYTKTGKFVDVVYEIEDPVAEEVLPCILDVEVSGDKVYVLSIADRTTGEFTLEQILPEQKEILRCRDSLPLYTADYNAANKRISTVNIFGFRTQYDVENQEVLTFDNEPGTLCSVYLNTDSYGDFRSDCLNRTSYLNDSATITDTLIQAANADGNKISFCDMHDNSAGIYDMAAKQLVRYYELPYSAKVFVINLVICLAYLYIVIFILLKIIMGLRSLIIAKDFIKLKAIFGVTVTFFAITGVVIFYTKQLYNTQIESMKLLVESICASVANTADDSFLDKVNEFDYDSNTDTATYFERIMTYAEIDDFFKKKLDGIPVEECDYFIYSSLTDPKSPIVYSTLLNYQIGMPIDMLNGNYDAAKSDRVQIIESAQSLAMCYDQPVKDPEGNVVGDLIYGINYRAYRDRLRQNCLELILTLLVAASGFYMLFTEAKSLRQTVSFKKKQLADKLAVNESVYSRQFGFLCYFCTSIDAIVAALVIRDLCNSSGLPASMTVAFISALPMIMYGASVIGSLIYTVLISKIPVRRYSSICAAVMIIMALGEAFGVQIGSIAVFFAARFIFYIFQENIYVLVVVLPTKAPTEEVRFEYHKSVTWSSVSSGILAGILGGYLAQYLGNTSIYVAVALVSVCIMIFVLLIFPKGAFYGHDDSSTEAKAETKAEAKLTFKQVFKFLTSPYILGYMLFLCLPQSIFRNYKSVLFPLVSAEYDLSKVMISNLYIIARTVNLLISSFTGKATKGLDMRKGAALIMIGCGLMFSGFTFVNPLVWAIVMIVVTDMYVKSSGPIHKMLARDYVMMLGINQDKAVGLLETFGPLLSCIQTPLIAFFLSFSTNTACLAVGGFGIICALLFLTITRKRRQKA